MKLKKLQKTAKWPEEVKPLKALQTQIELGEIGELDLEAILPAARSRYVVTYMNSQTRRRIRSSTVVSITNQSRFTNRVAVFFYRGLSSFFSGSCYYSIPPGYTVDIATRQIPGEITTVNCVSNPELDYHEGRALVNSVYPQIAVSSRVIYTEGTKDDSKVVEVREGNIGD